ncbi:MAG TPA: thioredoxin domain-containing protein [Polyangiaceae bacterium]|nr:thioredoxin domain-containing protein [Polyangiaceae bacterium]
MKSPPWLVAVRVAALVALGASGALLADYSGNAPTYCSAGSGCAAVRQAGWGYIPISSLYVPVPAAGAVAFALLLALSLLPDPRWRQRLTALGALLAAVIAIALLVVQGVLIGAFCTLCVMVDVSAIVAGMAAIGMLVSTGAKAREALQTWSWAALGLIAFLAPWYWPKARPVPDVPAEIQKLYKPGKINIVEFADFECPFCRRLHTTLSKVLGEYDGRVNFVRLNMPLSMHPHARDAAKAFICADEQGQGQRMGDILFESSPFGAPAQRHVAQTLKLDLDQYDRCVDSQQTEDRIDRESEILRNAGFDGLPTTYIGGVKIVGAQPENEFRAALDRAARGVGQRGVPWPIYLLLALGALVGIVAAGRRGSTAESSGA